MFVDTNIILRWLLGDNVLLSAQAEKLVSTSTTSSLIVTDIVVAEIVYVLRGTGRNRQQSAEALLLIGRTDAFKYENDEIIMAIIELLTSTNLDFADCYLLVRSRREKVHLETFDKQLNRLLTKFTL